MVFKKLFKILPFLALLRLPGCPTPPQPGDMDAAGREKAALAWNSFLANSARAGEQAAPFNATLSVRYKTPEEGERFGAYFWSNLERQGSGAPAQPLRLDILGAMNATAAMAYEDESVFLLYDTENNLAYRTDGSAESLMRLGLPLPLRLADLARLLNGRYAAFFLGDSDGDGAPGPHLVSSVGPENVFALTSGRGGELVLDQAGRPLRWLESGSGSGGDGWIFEFFYPVGAQAGQLNLPGPLRLQASHTDGYSVTVSVKNLNAPARPFTPEQLRLNLPDTVKIKQS
ncbi:MAG: hypothetical protein LBM64_09755 [Deltaproteobacteria bacterium]|nr:hypothetical protein [Deltaproteobacteria bacterium]